MPYRERFLREAIRLSIEKQTEGGGPFGAVVARGSEIVGRGWNRVVPENDPTAHAEIMAIRDACRNLGTFSLEGCEIYSSCEPCPMCLSAIYWAHLDDIHFAATRKDAAEAGFDDAAIYAEIPKAPAERAVPAYEHLREEAREAFRVWMDNPEKTRY